MKRLRCPVNGWRNIDEFVWGGEVKAAPAPDAGAEAWAAFVFLEENRRGVIREWWCHAPSSTWFQAERDTACDRVLRTFLPGQDVAASAA